MTSQNAEQADFRHRPVMLAEVLEALAPRDGGVYVDGTFGAGGYARGLLQAAACEVVGIDRDPAAIAGGEALKARYPERLHLVSGLYAEMEEIVHAAGFAGADGVTLDLGVSSMQLDEALRGFSFLRDGPLDMRMSQSGPTAADLVNALGEAELARIHSRIWRGTPRPCHCQDDRQGASKAASSNHLRSGGGGRKRAGARPSG